MDDKTMLEGILWDLKVLGDLCLHGSIESGTLDVHSCFVKSLNEVLNLQYDLFKEMSELGMYNVTNVEVSKIKKTYSKYNASLDG